MRFGWRNIIILLCMFNCSVYVRHSSDEIAHLPTDITPLPDSFFVLPDNQEQYILWFECHGDGRSTTYLIMADGGLLRVTWYLSGHKELSMRGHSDYNEIRKFIDSLNTMGYFSITEDIIRNKLHKKTTCCLGIFLAEPKIWPPPRWLPTTSFPPHYRIIFNLAVFYHEIEYPFEESVDYDVDCPELNILKQCIGIMEDFLTAQAWE